MLPLTTCDLLLRDMPVRASVSPWLNGGAGLSVESQAPPRAPSRQLSITAAVTVDAVPLRAALSWTELGAAMAPSPRSWRVASLPIPPAIPMFPSAADGPSPNGRCHTFFVFYLMLQV